VRVLKQCDYCGQAIGRDDLHVSLDVVGKVPRDDSRTFSWRPMNGSLGHFHTADGAGGEPSCFDRIYSAIALAQSVGPTLETIEVASGQWAAAQRRKFQRPEDGA
jgi:hypothetical protein